MGRKDSKQISFYVSEQLHREIKSTAKNLGKSIKAYIIDLHREREESKAQASILEEHRKLLMDFHKEIQVLKGMIVELHSLEPPISSPTEDENVDDGTTPSLYDVMSKEFHPEQSEEPSLHQLAKTGLTAVPKNQQKETVVDDPEADEFAKLVEEALSELSKTQAMEMDIQIKDSKGRTIKSLSSNLPKPNTQSMEQKYDEEFAKLIEEALKEF